MTITVQAGNEVTATVTFVPSSGTCALADVSARVIEQATGTVTALTPVAGATNVFTATVTVPDTAQTGTWVVRWESNAPSPKISIEDSTTSFEVLSSEFPTP